MGRGQGVFLKIKSYLMALGRYCIPRAGEASSFSMLQPTHSISLPGFPPDHWLGTGLVCRSARQACLVQYLAYQAYCLHPCPGCQTDRSVETSQPWGRPGVCVQVCRGQHLYTAGTSKTRAPGGWTARQAHLAHPAHQHRTHQPKHPPCAAQPTPPLGAQGAGELLLFRPPAARAEPSRTLFSPAAARLPPAPGLPN